MFNRQGKPEEELFLQSPTDSIAPTVEPLRISKYDSGTPPPKTSLTTQSNFPLPPGASSSANPLPYPDDPQDASPPRRTTQSPYSYRTATPEREPQRSPPTSHYAAYSVPPAQSSSTSDSHSMRSNDAANQKRRVEIPKLLPDSPGPDLPDKDGLFARPPARAAEPPLPVPGPSLSGGQPYRSDADPYAAFQQHYFPPPGEGSSTGSARPGGALSVPGATPSLNRLSSTASTATTKAQRGSPPPPETPIEPPGGSADIAARYAAAGIAGTATLNSLQAQNAAAALRQGPYPQPSAPPLITTGFSPQGSDDGPQRPWTPTELPGSQPFGPPTVYQGPGEAGNAPTSQPVSQPGNRPGQASITAGGPASQSTAQSLTGSHSLEQDFNRLHMSASPPPAYSSVTPGGVTGSSDKQQGGTTSRVNYAPVTVAATAATTAATTATAAAGVGAAVTAAAAMAHYPDDGGTQPPAHPSQQVAHPAFSNDSHRMGGSPPAQQSGMMASEIQPPVAGPSTAAGLGDAVTGAGVGVGAFAVTVAGPVSPPPLPEGWIAHLDQNSGQYYYIHLPTQSTQWEFPKGPTPLNFTEPLSPSGTSFANPLASPGLTAGYGAKPMASSGLTSPGFPPTTPGYSDSLMGMSSPSLGGAFSVPPPTAGVDMYRVAPTNGVYFGPYLRYTNIDMERALWLGSIMLVTDAPQPPTIHIHQSTDLSPNPRQLKANPIHTHQRWIFYRYDIDLMMQDEPEGTRWTYAITSHLGCTRYEFLVAGRNETSWRFIAHSGSDFSLNVNANERSKLGGVGFMWKDIMQKHVECGGFHTQLGLGNQIYADRLWKEIPLLKQWLAMSGKENRKNAAWTAQHEEDVTHAFFHYYTSHFDQPHLREAFAQIPFVLQIDDHDIFDGYGSYPDYMQLSNTFKAIGRIGIAAYLLFQQHTTHEILRNVSSDQDLFSITGSGYHFVKYLGPSVVVVGVDCRSERTQSQVMAGPSYQGLFPKIATLPPSVQHCILMISVPVVYPRLEAAESLANTVATGKKALTGTYNMLGKVTSSVAGVVGAKGAVAEGFNSAKKAVGKSGLMGGILSPFGDIDMLDELRDMWTHESKDLERTYLIRTLQGISHSRQIRMTFLSGAVNCCGAGLVHDPSHPSDHKTMYQIISSAVVSAPPPSYVLKLLHSSNKPLYVPANGHRSTHVVSDTKEDMMEVFAQDSGGRERDQKRLMGRRNYVACVAYDPEKLASGGLLGGAGGGAKSKGGLLSLAVDFMVQGEGSLAQPVKYGPVVIPGLEYGR